MGIVFLNQAGLVSLKYIKILDQSKGMQIFETDNPNQIISTLLIYNESNDITVKTDKPETLLIINT